VLEPYQKLAVMAVNRFVYAEIKETGENSVTLEDFGLRNMGWKYAGGKVAIDSEDTRVRFVEDAMSIVVRYLKEQRVTFEPFSLAIKSELDDTSGVKYGLGSSAAVVVSVVSAI